MIAVICEDSFGSRWSVPDEAMLRRDWSDDLAVMDGDCSCPGKYHLLWGALKLIGRNLGVYYDAQVLADVLSPILDEPSRILIVGAADRLVLRLLADLSTCGAPHAFSLIDRCPASLKLACAEATSSGLMLQTIAHELGEPLVMDEPVDVIFGHYVLNFLSLDTLRTVLGQFKAVLAPGGRAVFVQRSLHGSGRVLADEDWAAKTRARLAEHLPTSDAAWCLIDEALPSFARSRRDRGLGLTFADFEAEITACGFRIEAARQTDRQDRLTLDQKLDLPLDDGRVYVLAHR